MSASQAMFAGAYRRIQLCIVTLAVAIALFALWRYGVKAATGVLTGGAISFLNFLWLKQSMIGLTDRFANVQNQMPTPRTATLMLRFFLRYAAVVTVVFVIISSSAVSALGVLVGVLLSAPALLFEAIYEIAFMLRHGE